jgi:hypothetical protein
MVKKSREIFLNDTLPIGTNGSGRVRGLHPASCPTSGLPWSDPMNMTWLRFRAN